MSQSLPLSLAVHLGHYTPDYSPDHSSHLDHCNIRPDIDPGHRNSRHPDGKDCSGLRCNIHCRRLEAGGRHE